MVFPDFRFKILTLAIVVTTLVIGRQHPIFKILTYFVIGFRYLQIGICIPNVEFVLGLVGATLGTAVCSVAPAWIYLQVSPTTSNERWIAKVIPYTLYPYLEIT